MAYMVILTINDAYVIYLNKIQHEIIVAFIEKNLHLLHILKELNVLSHYHAN
jgi:hypothetical protein